MSGGPDPVPELLCAVYDAALGHRGWPEAVQAISEAFDGAQMLVSQGTLGDPESFTHAHTLDTTLFGRTGFKLRDGFDPRKNPAIRHGLKVAPGASADIRRFSPEDEYRAEPFWQEIMEPQGIRFPRLLSLVREGDYASGGFISLPNREVDGDMARRLDRLLPHLARALRIGDELQRLRRLEASTGSALEALTLGFVVVDGSLGIRGTNPMADAILGEADGLRAISGRLHVACPRRRRAVAAAVERRAAPAADPADSVVVGVPRASGGTPYVLRILPAAVTAGLGGGQQGAAGIVIADPARGARLPDGALIKSAFGLTEMEGAVAALVPRGLSKRQIAVRLGISENTVKSHLKAVYDKLGVRTQTELVRVLMS